MDGAILVVSGLSGELLAAVLDRKKQRVGVKTDTMSKTALDYLRGQNRMGPFLGMSPFWHPTSKAFGSSLLTHSFSREAMMDPCLRRGSTSCWPGKLACSAAQNTKWVWVQTLVSFKLFKGNHLQKGTLGYLRF